MNVVSIVLFVILAIFVTWLVIDTVIYVVKKVKAKRLKKKTQFVENQEENTTKD